MNTNTQSLILVERPAPGLALLTLNRPQQRNALSIALRTQFVAAVNSLAASDDPPRVLIVTGAGTAFCAGLDLAELSGPGAAAVLASVTTGNIVAALVQYPGVVIGAINGPAFTGGFELALACDLLIASESARFADTHGRVGVMPGWGLSQRLPRLVGAARAKQMSLTGDAIDARRAQAWGLVNEVVAADALLPRSIELAQAMLELPPDFLLRYKRLIDDGLEGSLAAGLELELRNAAEWKTGFDPAALAAHRAALQARGRGQR